MYPVIASLVCVIVLLIATIHRLLNRIDQLTARLIARRDDRLHEQMITVNEERRLTNESIGNLVDKVTQSVSNAVSTQSAVLQESVKVAWQPQPPPQTVPKEVVDRLRVKYNLPMVDGVVENDYGKDPTDDFLHEQFAATHQGSVMMPTEGEDSDEPFGVPGLKAVI